MFSGKFKRNIIFQLSIFALFVLLAGVAGWPVLTNLDGVIIGRDNDIFINPWADWWTLKAIQDSSVSLWRTDYIFHPTGANLSFHSFSHLNTAVSLLLRPIFNPLPAYNLSIWLNYPLIGFGMYKLARYLTKSEVSGILAGIAFAFSSHAMYQSSHPVLLSIWCFPLATLYFLRAVEEEQKQLALIGALFVFLGALTSTLLFFMMVLWFGFLTLFLWLDAGWKRPSLPILLTFVITCGISCTLLQLPLILDAVGNQNSSFIISDSRAAIAADIVAPIIPHWFLWLPRGLYFGFVGIYITLFARRSGGRLRVWVALLAVSYLISIGPRPELLGSPINVTLPWSLPFVPILRNMYRFNILTSFALSVLIAFGWLGIRQQLATPRSRQIGAVLLSTLLFADYAGPQIPTAPLVVSPFYVQTLAKVNDGVGLTHLPINRQFDKRYLFYQTLHGHKISNGVISRAEADTFQFMEENAILALRFGDGQTQLPPPNLDEALAQLAETGVGLLVFEKGFMEPDQLLMWDEALDRRPFYEDDLVVAYQIVE